MRKIKSSVLAKITASMLACILVFAGIPVGLVTGSNGDTLLAVDVWTDRGGEGPNVPGGTFEVGEVIILHLWVSADCQARLTVKGSDFTDSAEYALKAGTTYDLSPGPAMRADIGQWQVTIEVRAGDLYTFDTTWYTVIEAGSIPPSTPTPTPTPTPVPPPSDGEEAGITKIGSGQATELDALIALKMAEALLPVDLYMDADGDGQVTRGDARLILKWAVNNGS